MGALEGPALPGGGTRLQDRPENEIISSSVADPDPYIFWASRIRIHSTRYGSGSFHHQAKIVRKTLIPSVLGLLYNFISLKNDVNVSSKSN